MAMHLASTGTAAMTRSLVLGAVLTIAAACSVAAPHAETPGAFCARVGTDDTLRPIPATLVPAVNAAFHTSMPTEVATRMTVFRCADRRVMACGMGANLPCGKADTSRVSVGGAQWCKQHADAVFIPAYATGHATIFEWRCRDGAAVIAKQVFRVDPRGFVAEFWRNLPR